MVHNDTFVQLELMMPVMPLSKIKGIIYQFRSVIRWVLSHFGSEILLFHFKIVLENMASEISNLISHSKGSLKILIHPLHIYGDLFNSAYIQSDIIFYNIHKVYVKILYIEPFLDFDWTFSVDFELPNQCIIEHDIIVKALAMVQWKSFVFVNTSVAKTKTNSGCGSISPQRRTTTQPTIPKRSSTITAILEPSIVTCADFNYTFLRHPLRQ